jgi:hypothetical protein
MVWLGTKVTMRENEPWMISERKTVDGIVIAQMMKEVVQEPTVPVDPTLTS